MRPILQEPERWSDRPARSGAPGRASAEDVIGAALGRVRQSTEPSEAMLARAARGPIRSSPGLSALFLRASAGVALVMAMSGAVAAARGILYGGWLRPARSRVAAVSPSAAAPATARTARRHERRFADAVDGPPSTVEPGPPVPVPSLAAPAVPAASLRPPLEQPAPPVAPARPNRDRDLRAPEAPVTEARLLARAFRQLRADANATAALSSLDLIDRRFPNGALRVEATVARVEALDMLGQRARTLPLLLGIEALGGRPTRAVRIARAELLAEADRCAEALRDFDLLLATGEVDPIAGRALFGRAACHLRSAEPADARPDLERYLALFPEGPFAAAARGAIEGTP